LGGDFFFPDVAGELETVSTESTDAETDERMIGDAVASSWGDTARKNYHIERRAFNINY
jgi:hypothetical protein